jgi:transcriptional regulator with XRE-family HTH domain
VIRTHEEHLAHYGVKRRSGRYPWGSGGASPESTRNRDFLAEAAKLRKQGLSDAEIARGWGMTRNEFTAQRSIKRAEKKQEQILTAQRLEEKGWSRSEIAVRMGLAGESSVRALLRDGEKDKADSIQTTAKMLKSHVDKKEMVDVGKGVEVQLGITRTKLDTAIEVLKQEGYELHTNIKIPQVNIPGQYTVMKVLAKPGIEWADVSRNRANIKQIESYSIDHGRSFFGFQPPLSVNPRRLRVNYAETGGKELDGVIYVRPGVKDIHLGSDRYGQVRVKIGDNHYIKGMAVYKDDLPAGVDLVFNTSKSNTGRKVDALKKLEPDKELPFGSLVRQYHDPATGKVSSALNVVGLKEGSGVEGSWDTWSRSLSSQMLSKQDPSLAKKQLDVTYHNRIDEFNEINSLTNPTVRKDLLLKFADETDAAAVHLQAANLPRQATKVLLPVPSMKDTEVYAPGMRHGERVALVRYPHGGKFEIPELTVNNNNREAKKLISSGIDAIGINHNVAHHLSGADFDGDTVLVIPNGKRLVKNTPALQELKNFDPQTYRIEKGSGIPPVTNQIKQAQMGRVSNLITDMTIKGAKSDEIARAVKHSMVVIDSEKHQLNWKQSETDHGIPALKEKYQGSKRAGAQTIISRAGSDFRVPERVPRPASQGGPIDPKTGKKVYVLTKRTYRDPKGREAEAKTIMKRLAVEDDAHKIVSHNPVPMELLYADHSNRLKALANESRKTALPLKGRPYDPSAKAAYKNEVASLNAKLNNAKRNAPLERQAHILANAQVSARRRANPDIEKAELTKIRQQALNTARDRTGAQKEKIRITQEEWNAIQAGAISKSKLEEILTNSDLDTVRHLALPKQVPKMTSAKMLRAQSMLNSGYTQADVAAALGVSLSTLKVSLSE